ncbi:DUF2637 domain-containing protein [Nocardia pseudovaccinii]|uniref:DUF2637 domain-containing protein n=1 Tax=Nocardia pseudovaccinii TaxID=189540 RepID=UPI001470D89E|nr:DUF2637 domain-containing protein [Nocardia pseudovaccinii]
MNVTTLDPQSLQPTPAQPESKCVADAVTGEQDRAAAALAKARTFWWSVLAVSAAVSVLGNALHAWLRVASGNPALTQPKPGLTITLLPPAVAAALAALIPISLMVHTHGLALLVQAPSKYGWVSRAVVLVVIVLLGAGGFYLSFEALYELAMQAGFGANQAKVFPFLVDGSIGGATFVLLSLPPRQAKASQAAPKIAEVAAQLPDESHQLRPAHDLRMVSAVPTAVVAAHRTTAVEAMPVAKSHHCVHPAGRQRQSRVPTVRSAGTRAHRSRLSGNSRSRDWSVVAERLCSGSSTRDPEQVAKILYLSFDRGMEPWHVAAEVGWKERAVSRIVDDARPHCLVSMAS